MVLYHLHNPGNPAFVHSCNCCAQNIVGPRWSCTVCSDFDVCSTCKDKPGFNHDHRLTLRKFQILSTEQAKNKRHRERIQRRKLKRQLELLTHVMCCLNNTNCGVENCQKMKQVLVHTSICKIGTKGCQTCSRVWRLLYEHANVCRVADTTGEVCPVPRCAAIRRLARHRRQLENARNDRRARQYTAAVREASTTSIVPASSSSSSSSKNEVAIVPSSRK